MSDISDYFRSKIRMLLTFDFARSNESIIKVAHNLHIKGLLSIYWERCSLFYLTNTLVLVFFISFSNSMHLWFKGLTEFTFWNCDWKEEFIISKRYWTKCRLNLFNAAACWFFFITRIWCPAMEAAIFSNFQINSRFGGVGLQKNCFCYSFFINVFH